MKALIKTACVLALALSLGACSKDDPKRDIVPAGGNPEKPADPASKTAVSASAVVNVVYPVRGAAGEVFKDGYNEIVVTLPSEKDETVAEVYTLNVDSPSLIGNAANPEGGSEILNLNQEDQVQELARIQILDKFITSFVVTRFSDDKLVDGKSYIFVQNEDKEMKLVQVVQLNEGNSDETVVALIREFAEGLQVSSAEAILEMAKDEKNFHLIQVESADGSKATYSRADVRFNKGK